MHNLTSVWFTGSFATLTTAASTVFNAILAVNNTSNATLQQVLRILLFVGLGFSFLGSLSLLYFTTFFVRNVKRRYLYLKKVVWSVYACGLAINLVAVALCLTTLIWLLVKQSDLPDLILGNAPIVWLAAWFGCLGLSILSQWLLFIILGLWVNQNFKTQSSSRLDIDYGTRLPPTGREVTSDDRRSFSSRGPTIVELPRTPSGKRPVSAPRFSAPALIPIPSTESRSRLVGPNRSAKSSLDMPFPAGEAQSLDNAFDRWDTSSVHDEMRAVVGAPPMSRGGLETIPGSRPESLEEAPDGHTLPPSPQVVASSPPAQAISSDTATALGDWSSSPARNIPTSSPPSSPPNFSRPTSKHKNQPWMASFETSMQEIIHPLFRASSPHPPPIATMGTMVTASPLANQPITPRTLANLRSLSKSTSDGSLQNLKSTGHWRAMPSVSHTVDRRPSTSGSQGPASPPPGSPGPSIADEQELPPILPGFVLSAGQRSSMLGYANRKSVRRNRRGSQMSGG